jgi:hypothetical protein
VETFSLRMEDFNNFVQVGIHLIILFYMYAIK